MMGRNEWMSATLGSALLIGLTLSVGCSDEVENVTALLPAVSASQIESVDFDEEIHASGELEARFHTMIAAEIEGRVTELAIDEGGSVVKGQTVIEIDPQRRKLDLGAATARRAQARANYRKEKSQTERVRKLRSEKIASLQKIEEAETALLLAQAELEAEEAAVGVAQRALDDASVSAPFDGLVARRLVDLGEFVQPGTVLFELVSLNPMEAVFSLTELDTERVRLDQPIQVQVGAFKDRTFHGKVTFVAPTIDPETRTLRIKAEIDNSDGALRPGLFARVSLGVSRREKVLMVPEEAVIQRASSAYVFRVLEDDRVERVAIETGAQDQGRVEIRGPIEAGDWIVTRGHGGLSDGMVVAVRERQSSAQSDVPAIASGALR
jgi:membrane fusion protein (multidrug efflux system)